MNKKILVSFTAFLIVAMMLTPLALANSWDPKNNDKFQSFDTVFTFGPGSNYVNIFNPFEEVPNKVVQTYDENMLTYTITVGVNSYEFGTDFVYDGQVALTIWDPEVPLAIPAFYTPCRKMAITVKYTYTFLPASGIEGTIKMLAISKGETVADLMAPGAMQITSLQGTDSLQNINIKATGGGGLTHTGIVSGWPE